MCSGFYFANLIFGTIRLFFKGVIMGQNIDPRFTNEKIHEAIKQLASVGETFKPKSCQRKIRRWRSWTD